MSFRVFVLVVLALCSADVASAQESNRNGAGSAGAAAVPAGRAARRDGPVILDGRLDDVAWRSADALRGFTQSWPNPGQPASDSTEARVLYDDDAILVGIRAYDARPDSIAAQLARRDASGIYSDWLHVVIDSYHDRRTGFRFSVNPKGVQKDVFHSNDTGEDLNWDAVWDVATRVDSLGWVAEIRIPLSQLRFGDAAPQAERRWGFQVQRDVARREERSSWSPWKAEDGAYVSKFGTIGGITNLSQPQRLEVLPYVSTKVTRAPGGGASATNPFFEKTDTRPNIGADVKYGLPAGLTLTATINPDFGQVELDPAQVNLSAFETFFEEKRPFFLEGSDVFSFGRLRHHNDYGGQTFFYTRRIGRPPSRFPSGAGIQYVDMPEETSIAGAAKVSGRVGPWTVGILDALTLEERADVAGPTGTVDSSTVVEPLSNFFSGRVRRDFRSGQSVLGGMLTMLNRQQSATFTNLLTTSSGFAGTDFEHRWSNGRYILGGFVVGSRVNASSSVLNSIQRSSARYLHRPDATTLSYDPGRTSLTGHYTELVLSQTGKWFGSLAVKEVSPYFEINDVGFQTRVDYRAISPFYGYQTNQADSWSRSKFFGLWTNHTWNFDGNKIYEGIGGSSSVTLTNFWGGNLGASYQLPVYSDRLLRGGPLAYMPASYNVNGSFYTDTRRRIWFNPYVNLAKTLGEDSWSASGGIYTETRPSTNIHITFGPNYFRQQSVAQFVTRVADATSPVYGTRYVFANLDQTTLGLETRINWTLTPRLSLQSYVQPFVAIGSYSNFKEFTEPRGFAFARYGADRGTITPGVNSSGAAIYTVDPDDGGPAAAFDVSNPNFNSHSLRGNAVLRWEYRPGSVLFLVWQQQRAGGENAFDFDAGRDVGAIFREQPTNIFMIKAAYWLSK
ncbi:MAG TPA: DUF5916 domain-containing protein [Gemmatimonadaceae bacterium]|nr:DUF5916 domain-containing protein [Gemmatimonadaceae bacterium]